MVVAGHSWSDKPKLDGLGTQVTSGPQNESDTVISPLGQRAGVRPVVRPPRLSMTAAHPAPSRLAKSRHQSQLGIDGLEVAHARSIWLRAADSTSPSDVLLPRRAA